MFTGLIEELGTVHDVRRDGDGAALTIDCALARSLNAGDSVAVNGVCLTATDAGVDRLVAQAMAETLQRTSLAGVQPGARVNLERPLRADARLGGHIVQGHVDATATVAGVRDEGFARRLQLGAPSRLLRYVVERGSIALDGVSLTVVEVGEQGFAVALIPETLRRTNLGLLEAGATVNVEVDVIAKYVERLVDR